MELWIDGKKIGNYFADTVDTTVALGAGHTPPLLLRLIRRAHSSNLRASVFSVGSTSGACTPPSSPGAILCSPVAGQTYGSPIQVTGAGTLASVAVNHLELWIDGKKIGNYPGNTINTTVAESAGSHAATLVAVDAKGNFLKSAAVNFIVQ